MSQTHEPQSATQDGAFFLQLPILVAASLALLATLRNGATQHGPALLLRAMVAALIVSLWPNDTVILRWRDLAAPLVAVAVVTVGWATSVDFGLALQSWISVMMVCLLYITLLAAERDWTTRLLVFAGAMGVLHSMLAVGQRLVSGLPRGMGGFFSPNDLAAFVAPLVILCWHATRRSLPHRDGYLYAGAAFWLALGLWATASRAGFLAVALGGVVWGVPRWRQRPWLVLLACLAAAASYFLLKARWQDPDPYAYSRWAIWQESIQVALKHPWGVGLGHYAEVMRQHGVPLHDWVRFPHVANNAHNELLQAWVELGWPGILTTLLAMGLLVACMSSQYEAGLHLGVMVSFAVPALTSASLHVPPVAFLAAVWAARVVRADGRFSEEWVVPRVVPILTLLVVMLALPSALSALTMQHAAAARDRHDYPHALKLADYAVKLTPWSMGSALLLESLRYLSGDPPLEVTERLMNLADRFPESPDPWVRAAELLQVQASEVPERWHVVAQLWEQAAQRDPRNALMWNHVGEGRLHSGDEAGARRAWERAVQEEPHCARALMNLALHTSNAASRDSYRTAAHAADREAPRYKDYAHQVLSLEHGPAS